MIVAMSQDEELRALGFDVLEETRHGGSSVVRRARRIADGEDVAVKIVLGDPGRVERELSIGRRVRHPRLALATEGGMLTDGRAFLVSTWCVGRPLADLLRDGPLSESRVLSVVDDVVEALAALHAVDVVHRDITPSNIVVEGDRAVVIDVGLGRSAEDATVTATGDLAGTPRYLAPEVIRGGSPTPAADQYALALVAHEALTGSSPFPEAGTAATSLHHQLHTVPTPVDEIAPSIPASIAVAIERALSKDPDDRWPDVRAFGVGLRDTSSGRRTRPRALVPIVVGASFAAAAGMTTVAILDDDAEPAATATAEPVETVEPVETTEVATTTTETPEIPAAIASSAPAGAAAALDCNLQGTTSFEDGAYGPNYFDNPDPTLDGSERTVSSGGVDGSGALVVGDPGRYGRYAQYVAVLPGQRYRFSAAVLPVGVLFDAGLEIGWLDADFSLLDETDLPSTSLTAVEAGRHEIVSDPAPDAARYAVPTIAKDDSPGYLIVDELVFAEAPTDCRP